MYNIKLSGLDTGRIYYVKIRAKVNGYQNSEWSIPFKFETPRDTMPPGRIENLSFLSEGDSFIANWDAPQFNEDGTPCGDISHYRLIFKDLDNDRTRTERVDGTSFSMDFNRNVQMFGTPAGRIELTVTALDLSGNESRPVIAIAQNPPPSKVKNVSASSGVESIALTWDASPDTDLLNYEVHVGATADFDPTNDTLRAKVAPGTNTFTHDSSSLVMLYIKIVAVDKFHQRSDPSDVVSAQPRLATDYDKEPPGAVTGLTVTQHLAEDNASAVARVSYTARTEEDLDKYEVQYRRTGEATLPWSFATIPSDETSAEIKPLPLATDYDFRVRAVDFNANKGAWSSVVVAEGVKKTTLPDAPTNVTVRGGLTNLMVTWTASTDPSMSNWSGTYEVQTSKATNFSSPITINSSGTLASFINLDANTVYYVRVRSIDPYGNVGAWSSVANGNTGTVADSGASRVIWSSTEPGGGKENDLWIKLPENVKHRFDGSDWVKAQDTELAGEISDAIAAADGKNTIYYSTPPTTGIREGDTWFDGPVIKLYKNGVWTDVSSALDNDRADQAIQVAGEKNKTYYVSRATAVDMIEGDILFDPTEGNRLYRYDGNEWISSYDTAIDAAAEAANKAQRTADGKNTIFYETPTGELRNGDTWFDGPLIKTYRDGEWVDSSSALVTEQGESALEIAGTKNKSYTTTYANRPIEGLTVGDLLFDTADKFKSYRWNGSAWESVRDRTIEDAQATAEARNRNVYSTEPASGASRNGQPFIDGDTWFRRDSADAIIGMWEFQGGSWISKTLNNEVIANLDAGKINAGTIDADRIGAKSIDTSKIVVGGLDASVVIEDGSITASELGADSVIAGKIATGAVTAGSIEAGAVKAEDIDAEQINASHIVSEGIDGSVVIKDGTLTATQIAGETITGDKIRGNAIEAKHLQAGSITIGGPNGHIADGQVAVPSDIIDALADAAEEAERLAGIASAAAEQAAKDHADGKITDSEASVIAEAAKDAEAKANAARDAAAEVAKGYTDQTVLPINTTLENWGYGEDVTYIDGGQIFTGTITSSQIKAGAIVAGKIDADAIDADNIQSRSIRTDHIVLEGLDGSTAITDESITTDKINARAITAQKIAAGAITIGGADGHIPDGAVAVPSDVTAAEEKAERELEAVNNALIADASAKAEAAQNEAVRLAGLYADGEVGEAEVRAAAEAARIAEAERLEAIKQAAIDAETAYGGARDKVDQWTFTGTTKINGGEIEADTISAAQIAAGAITVGPNAPIKPGSVAIPSDITAAEERASQELAAAQAALIQDATTKADNAKRDAEEAAKQYADNEIGASELRAATEAARIAEEERLEAIRLANEHTDATVGPINTTLDGWKYGDTTFINGGSIYTRTIDADSIKANSLTADEIAAGTITAEQIAADAITAREIEAESITGEELAANLALVNNLKVRSSIEIDSANGHIRSSNYNADGSAGFYMDHQQLIINDGQISASALDIQDSYNMMPAAIAAFNFSPSYYSRNAWPSNGASFEQSRLTGRAGSGSLLHKNGGEIGFLIEEAPVLEAGEYIFSAYVKRDSGGSDARASITAGVVGLLSGGEVEFSSNEVVLSNTTDWVRLQVLVRVDETTVLLPIFNHGGPSSAEIRWSHTQVERVIAGNKTASPWTPPGFTSINGESITTGSITSSSTVSTGNGDIARWSINTNGDARFADATIDGKLVVGGYNTDAENERVSIQSDTYSEGRAGWAIKGNGDVEFNNGTFRGMLNLGRSLGEEARPTMTASVSNIKLYTDETTYRDIDVASIQGTTYAYNRIEENDDGIFTPTEPDINRNANYYFGPTTDRSVNIQVHDGSDERSVYLDNPPLDVALTSLFVGEITSPSQPPLAREEQGFSYKSVRREADPDNDQRESSTQVSQRSSVRLRSPFYPEAIEEDPYPESSHVLSSQVAFNAPENKNLINRSEALPSLLTPDTTDRPGRSRYRGRVYYMGHQTNRSSYMEIDTRRRPSAGKKHIFSVYIDTLDRSSPTGVYAFINDVPMKVLGNSIRTEDVQGLDYTNGLDLENPEQYYTFDSRSTRYTSRGSQNNDLFATTGAVSQHTPGAVYVGQDTRYQIDSGYNMSQGMTVSLWMNPTSTSGDRVFFHRAANTSREVWIQYESANQRITGGVAGGSSPTIFSSPSNIVPRNQWTHLTVTIDPYTGSGAKYLRIFTNGVQRQSVQLSGWTVAWWGTEPTYIFGNMQLHSFYRGSISELVILNRNLTAPSVRNLYNAGTPVLGTGGRTVSADNGAPAFGGQEETRVSFEYTPTTSTDSKITIQTVSEDEEQVYAYKLQLEEAKYMEDPDLNETIRSLVAPTPWATDGSSAGGFAELRLKTTPATDYDTWVSESVLSEANRFGTDLDATERTSPTEMELTLSTMYASTLHQTSAIVADATYKWSPAGVSYPGMAVPYMPSGASIVWDYAELSSGSRPLLGGSNVSNRSISINDPGADYGAINIGSAQPIRDNFNRSDTASGTIGGRWQSYGPVTGRIFSNVFRHQSSSHVRESGPTTRYYYHPQQLTDGNQILTFDVADHLTGFGITRYAPNISVLLALDPHTGDRIELRILDHSEAMPSGRGVQVMVVRDGSAVWTHVENYSSRINGWEDWMFTRNGRFIQVGRQSGALVSINVPESIDMPNGRHVGIHVHAARLDNFAATDAALGADGYGMLMPHSINVNNGRGITVRPNGTILVDVPGYYMVTATIYGVMGSNDSRDYWLELQDHHSGWMTPHPLGGKYNNTSAMGYVSGSAVCYLQGTVYLTANTETTTGGRVSGANLDIVRVA